MEIVLASQNQGKRQELHSYIKLPEITLKTADKNLNPNENGQTFFQNAFIKATAYYQYLKKPVLADDSGLMLDAFPEIMGVDTANYRSDLGNYSEKCCALVKLYEEKKETDRGASFICVLCLFLNPQEIFFFEGHLRGTISPQLKGNAGFGYDPIFIPENKIETLAEIPEWKNIHSHRAKAAKSLSDLLRIQLIHKNLL